VPLGRYIVYICTQGVALTAKSISSSSSTKDARGSMAAINAMMACVAGRLN